MNKYTIVILLLIFLAGFSAGCRPKHKDFSASAPDDPVAPNHKTEVTAQLPPPEIEQSEQQTCRYPVNSSHVPLPEEMPEDFDIRFEFGRSQVDTYSGKMCRDMITEGVNQAEFEVSLSTKEKWYARLQKYKLYGIEKEMTSQILSSDGTCFDMTPCTHYTVTFTADGQQYRIAGDETARHYIDESDAARCFIAFCDEMKEELCATDVYTSFGEP